MIERLLSKRKMHQEAWELINWVMISGLLNILGMSIGYIVTLLNARRFWANWVWLMWLINTFIVFGTAIWWLGVQWSIVRFINQFKTNNQEWKMHGVFLFLLTRVTPFTILLSMLLYFSRNMIASVLNEPGLIHLLTILALALPFLVLKNILLQVFKWYKEIVYFNLFWRVLFQILKLILISIFFYISYSVYGATYGLIFSGVILLIIMLPFFIKRWQNIPEKENIDFWSILKVSWPLMIVSIAFMLNMQTDIFMLGLFRGTNEVGVYTTAFTLAYLVIFGLLMVDIVIWPKIAEQFRWNQREGLQKTMAIWANIATISWVILGVIFITFAKFRMWIFWSEFVAWAIILQILCIGQIFNSMWWSVWSYLSMTGREKILQHIILWSAGVNILLNYFLIPEYWWVGAAIASIAGLLTRNIAMVWYVRKQDWIISCFMPFIKQIK